MPLQESSSTSSYSLDSSSIQTPTTVISLKLRNVSCCYGFCCTFRFAHRFIRDLFFFGGSTAQVYELSACRSGDLLWLSSTIHYLLLQWVDALCCSFARSLTFIPLLCRFVCALRFFLLLLFTSSGICRNRKNLMFVHVSRSSENFDGCIRLTDLQCLWLSVSLSVAVFICSLSMLRKLVAL